MALTVSGMALATGVLMNPEPAVSAVPLTIHRILRHKRKKWPGNRKLLKNESVDDNPLGRCTI